MNNNLKLVILTLVSSLLGGLVGGYFVSHTKLDPIVKSAPLLRNVGVVEKVAENSLTLRVNSMDASTMQEKTESKEILVNGETAFVGNLKAESGEEVPLTLTGIKEGDNIIAYAGKDIADATTFTATVISLLTPGNAPLDISNNPAVPMPLTFVKPKAAKNTATSTQPQSKGLQHKVIQEGTGAQPTSASTVLIKFSSKLLDGTEYSSSPKDGSPSKFAVKSLARGLAQGIQMMKVGGQSEFTIPAELAYGKAGRKGVPPNSTVVITVELVDVQ